MFRILRKMSAKKTFFVKNASFRHYILKNICIKNLDFWEIKDVRPHFEIHEVTEQNSVFQMFKILKKPSSNKTLFVNI